MPNHPADNPPRDFREGDVLSASQLNNMLKMLATLIIGDGRTVRVRTIGNQLIIEAIGGPGRPGTVDLKVPADVTNWVPAQVSLFSEENGDNPAPLGTYINDDGVRCSVETKWG